MNLYQKDVASRIYLYQNAFNEGRALFWLEAMYGVPTLRNMERDFGIIPVPKFDESNEYAFKQNLRILLDLQIY